MIGHRLAFWAILPAAFFFGAGARAHNWYPLDCCGGYDCGPATMQTVAGAAYFAGLPVPAEGMPPLVSEVTVTNALGVTQTVIVPQNFPRRQSPDGRMHACIVAGKLQCLFMPPAM